MRNFAFFLVFAFLAITLSGQGVKEVKREQARLDNSQKIKEVSGIEISKGKDHTFLYDNKTEPNGDNGDVYMGYMPISRDCDGISAFPFNEGFNATPFPAECWTLTQSSSYTWERVTSGGNPSCTPKAGSGMLRYNSYSANNNATAQLITPVIDMGGNDLQVKFWMYRSDSGSSYTDRVNIYSNTTASAVGATLLMTVHQNIGKTPIVSANGWYQYVATLPSTTQYVIIEAYSNYGFNLFIDEFSIEEYSGIDAELAAITYPVAGSNINLPADCKVKVMIKNNGTTSISNFNLKLEFNNTLVATESYSGTIAKNTSAEYEFMQDIDLSAAGSYTIKVSLDGVTDDSDATNDSKTITVVNSVCVAPAIPYDYGFEDGTNQTVISGCFIQDGTDLTTTNAWTYNSSLTDYNRTPRTGSFNAYLRYSNTRWLFKSFELPVGDYKFSVWARQNSTSDASMTIKYGTAPTAADMTNTIVHQQAIVNGDYQEVSGYLAIETAGTYYIGILGEIGNAPWYMSIDDILLVAVSVLDGEIAGITHPVSGNNINLSDAEHVKAVVRNNGNSPLSGFQLKLEVNDETIATEAYDGDPIGKLGGEAEYVFQEAVDMSLEGSYLIKVTLLYNDDQNPANDTYSITANNKICNTTSPWNYGFEDGANGIIIGSGDCFLQDGTPDVSHSWIFNNETTYNRTPRTGNFNACLKYNSDRWLFREVTLTPGDYQFSVWARQDGSTSAAASLTLKFGTEATAAGMTGTICAKKGLVNGAYQEVSGLFEITEAGNYYIGILGEINGAPWYISIDDISLVQLQITDAEISEIIHPALKNINLTNDEHVKVKVVNTGTSVINTFQLKLEVNGETVAIETYSGEPLPKLGGFVEYTFTAGIDMSAEGSYSIKVTLIAPDDELPENDIKTIIAWNYVCTTDIPLYCGFENGIDEDINIPCFTQDYPASPSTDNSWRINTTKTDYNRTPRTGSANAILRYSNSRWLFREVTLTAGDYLFSVWARQDGATSDNASITLKYGTEATASGMANTICAKKGIVNGDYQEINGKFNITTAGNYVLGIYGEINFSPYYISIDDISLTKMLNNDLSAVSVTGPKAVFQESVNTYTVTVQNVGVIAQDADAYSVKLKLADGTEVGTAPGVAINALEKKTIDITWTTALDMSVGPDSVYAEIVMIGAVVDENLSNNKTSNYAIIKVPAGLTPLTVGEGTTGVNLPYRFLYKNSLSQTLYYPEELTTNGGKIYGLSYTSRIGGINEKPTMVWIGETTHTNLAENWVEPSTLTLVYDGTLNFPAGTAQEIVVPFLEPYEYHGGTLVVYSYRHDTATHGVSNDNWFVGSTQANSSRSRLYFIDNATSINPDDVKPSLGSVLHTYPNTKFMFDMSNTGSLLGVVKCNNVAVDGVKIAIGDWSYTVTTGSEGDYKFLYVEAGTYQVTASKMGYYDKTLSITIVPGVNTLDFNIELLPIVNLTGLVKGNDNNPLPGVAITLSRAGYADFTATTGTDGMYEITGIYGALSYNITAIKDGYTAHTGTVSVGTTLTNDYPFTMIETLFPVSTVIAEIVGDNTTITWEPRVHTAYQLSDNTAEGGFYMFAGEAASIGNKFTVNESGLLTSIDVYGTLNSDSNGGKVTIEVYNEAKTLVGTSAPFAIQPNAWTHIPLLEAIPYDGTFYAMVHWSDTEANATNYLAYDNNSANATSGLDWAILDGTWFPCSSFYIQFDISSPIVWMIRANAVSQSGRSVTYGEAKQSRSNKHANAPVTIPQLNAGISHEGSVAPAMIATEPDRSFSGKYNLYRVKEGVDAIETLSENTPLHIYNDTQWSQQTWGVYKYAVEAVYSGNYKSELTFSNPLDKDMLITYTINVTSNIGADVAGAVVKLTNIDGIAAHAYNAVATTGGQVVFNNVYRGTYRLNITMNGHFNLAEEIDVTLAGGSYDAELKELTYAPTDLSISVTQESQSAILTWEEPVAYTPFYDGAEDYDNFIISNFNHPMGDYTLLDLDNANTYGWDTDDYGNQIISWDNIGTKMSWIVFNPSATTSYGAISPIYEFDEDLAGCVPHTGNKVFASISNRYYTNNDWLILPKLSIMDGIAFKFWAKSSGISDWGKERLKVGVSTIGTATTDFTFINTGAYIEVPYEWTEYTFDLSAYADQDVYLALNCVSLDKWMLFIDDISVNFDNSKQFTQKYNVYLDNIKVAGPISETTYELTNIPTGNHVAGVSAVHSTSESVIKTIEFTITAVNVIGYTPYNNQTWTTFEVGDNLAYIDFTGSIAGSALTDIVFKEGTTVVTPQISVTGVGHDRLEIKYNYARGNVYTITIPATAIANYYGNDIVYTFTIPAMHQLTFLVVDNVGGIIAAVSEGATLTSPSTLIDGSSVTFTATPSQVAPGYHVKEWKKNGQAVGSELTYTTNITETTTVTVEFEQNQSNYTVTYSVPGGNGNLTATLNGSPLSSGTEVPAGSTVIFTATANSGYHIKGWKLEGEAVNGTAPTYTLVINKTTNVIVEFEQDQLNYTVTYSVPGGNGSLAATLNGQPFASGTEVATGSSVIFTATANSGYHIKGWTLNGEAVNGTSTIYTLVVNLTSIVTVAFEQDQLTYPVNFVVVNGNGTLTAALNNGTSLTDGQHVDAGSTVIFTATPISDLYKVKEWKDGGETVNGIAPTYTKTINSSTTITVEFELKDGINSLTLQNQVAIYPNPSKGLVNITVTKNSTVTVYDITGKVISNSKVTDKGQIMLEQPAGVYLIKVSSDNEVSTHRLVIIK